MGAPFTTKYLILSYEALGEPDWSFDLVKGLQNQFAGVWRVKTLEDFVVRMSKTNPVHDVHQYLVSLENYPEERMRILREWIKRSEDRKLTHMYNTITSSCAMEALNVLEAVRSADVVLTPEELEHINALERLGNATLKTAKRFLFWLDDHVVTPFEVYPTFARNALKERALFDKDLQDLPQDPLWNEMVN